MLNVGIFLFDDVEVLDFAGPFEVFAVTSELSSFSLLKVFTVSHLREIAPLSMVDGESRFVDNGKIMTSAGISAGIDLSLHIAKSSFGAEVAGKTIEYMEYGDWK